MTLFDSNAHPTPDEAIAQSLLPDTLSDLQMRIARRADELVRERDEGQGLHRHCWLLAEAEITRALVAGDFTAVLAEAVINNRTGVSANARRLAADAGALPSQSASP